MLVISDWRKETRTFNSCRILVKDPVRSQLMSFTRVLCVMKGISRGLTIPGTRVRA